MLNHDVACRGRAAKDLEGQLKLRNVGHGKIEVAVGKGVACPL